MGRQRLELYDGPPGEPSWNTMAVLTVFAEGRWTAIKAAAKARRRWPSKWLTDLDAAYSALLHHPHSTESQLLWHHDLMVWLGANERATRVLQACLARFPDSPVLHERLRKHVVKDRGVSELEAVYGEMLRGKPDSASLKWFAGYASIVAAESHRRRGRWERSVEAYDRAVGHYETAAKANPDWAESSSHHISLCLAGKSRVAYELEDDATALSNIVASFERSPGSAGTKDGLGITPASTAQMLISRLTEQGKDKEVEKIVAALGKLDPALLVPEEK